MIRLVLLSSLVVSSALSCFGADYRLQTLETAQEMFHAASNTAMYGEAAQHYNYLVKEEGIHNGHLFYTLGNCWYMAGDVGRAILNYRRAESYLPGNGDIEHNLNAARSMRIDMIEKQDPNPLAKRFLGWHLDTSPSLRWQLFACSWIAFWGMLYWTRRSRKREAKIATVLFGGISFILLTSLGVDALKAWQTKPGVIVAREVLARKGDGTMYSPAFVKPLHSGTEFRQLERRGDWRKILLENGATCWIPANAAELVALSGE